MSSDNPQIHAHDPAKRARVMADRLCLDMVDAACPAGLQRALEDNQSLVVIFKTPDSSWVEPVADLVRDRYPKALIVACHKAGSRGQQLWSSDDLVPHLHARAVIGISHDPEVLLPDLLLHAQDRRINLGRPSRAIVQTLIIEQTAAVPRQLHTVELDRLDAPHILAALRPAASAGAMVHRLKQAVAEMLTLPNVPDAPQLSRLCLPDEIGTWALNAAQALSRGDGLGLEPVLLVGPPGTGKTTLMRSLAATAGVPLIATDAGQWLQTGRGHLGDVTTAMASFFSTLATSGPCVGVIDELDSIPDRTRVSGDFDPWWTNMTNALLTHIDRMVQSGHPVLLAGISNMPHRLDPALTRPGRLGRHIVVPLPQTPCQRLAMLRLHLPAALEHADLSLLLPYLNSQSQARLGQLARTAMAIASGQKAELSGAHLLEALLPPDMRSPTLRRTVAWHEAGHALTAILLGRQVNYFSILRHPGAEGETDIAPEPSGVTTLPVIEDEVKILLGGRAADLVSGVGATSGARSDLHRANELLSDAYLNLWMAGAPTTLLLPGSPMSVEGRRAIVETRMEELLAETVVALSEHREALEALANTVLSQAVVTAGELRALLLPFGIKSDILPRNDDK